MRAQPTVLPWGIGKRRSRPSNRVCHMKAATSRDRFPRIRVHEPEAVSPTVAFSPASDEASLSRRLDRPASCRNRGTVRGDSLGARLRIGSGADKTCTASAANPRVHSSGKPSSPKTDGARETARRANGGLFNQPRHHQSPNAGRFHGETARDIALSVNEKKARPSRLQARKAPQPLDVCRQLPSIS
jgi:hypothetical protein